MPDSNIITPPTLRQRAKEKIRHEKAKAIQALPLDEARQMLHLVAAALLDINLNDISESKQAVAALRESEARLSKAQEIAHLGSWDLDLSTNRLIWSDEVYRIFGLKPQEFFPTYETTLNGYETTAVIRNPDSVVRDHAIPIIALTANAFKEDRNSCLAAGMDDISPSRLT